MKFSPYSIASGTAGGGAGVRGEPPGGGVERLRVAALLPERDARIGAEEHERAAARPVLARHDVGEPVAGGRRRGVEQALDVDLAPAPERELEGVGEAPVAGHA